MIYAKDTKVSADRSKMEIENTLKRYGATAFAYASRADAAMIEFQISGKRIRFILPLPDQNSEDFTKGGCIRTNYHSDDRAPELHSGGCFRMLPPEMALRNWEQACRASWRALSLVVKAKLEAVASNITTLEQEFMAHIVLPGGKTVGQMMLPRIDEAYKTGKVPEMGWEGPQR